MYIKDRFHQLGLSDFNKPIGFRMNPENCWIKKAAASENEGTLILDVTCAPLMKKDYR